MPRNRKLDDIINAEFAEVKLLPAPENLMTEMERMRQRAIADVKRNAERSPNSAEPAAEAVLG
jgi:hypothetical protein